MLILARAVDESILIGDSTEIMVTGINEHKVRLGIAAPENIQVMRTELKDKESRKLIRTNNVLKLRLDDLMLKISKLADDKKQLAVSALPGLLTTKYSNEFNYSIRVLNALLESSK